MPLASFFGGEPKSINRGENHYNSQHVKLFEYSIGARAIMALDWCYGSLLSSRNFATIAT